MIEIIIDWVITHWLWMFVLSLITIIASLASVSALIISLPPDYFTRKKHLSRIRNPIFRVFLRILKNALGVVALITGFIMLFTPGQGIMTILVGVILCNFPGKRKLERKLIERPLVLSTINRIRVQYKRPPIVLDDNEKGLSL